MKCHVRRRTAVNKPASASSFTCIEHGLIFFRAVSAVPLQMFDMTTIKTHALESIDIPPRTVLFSAIGLASFEPSCLTLNARSVDSFISCRLYSYNIFSLTSISATSLRFLRLTKSAHTPRTGCSSKSLPGEPHRAAFPTFKVRQSAHQSCLNALPLLHFDFMETASH